MKYEFVNGEILDGTKDMQPKEGLAVLTDGEYLAVHKCVFHIFSSLSVKALNVL